LMVWVMVVGIVLPFVLFYLWRTFGFQVMDCTPPDTTRHTPAISVEVHANRTNGRMTERHPLGCTFYDYTGR